MRFPKGTTEHPINKSGKRKILVSVWDFGATHPQSERSYYLCNDHPAKMRPSLARAILHLYGESPVLDPMAGVGTTLVEAMLLGMNAIGVEYEKKFVDQTNENIKHLQKIQKDKNLGKAVCIQGDARNLSCVKNVNTVLFSPPYFNALKKGVGGPSSNNKRVSYEERIKRFQGYSRDPSNIGNIPQFGSIFFSPPYFDALSITKGGGSKSSILHEETTKQLQLRRSGPFAVKKNLPTSYSSKLGNIGNISQFGSIIFSPRYCGVMDAKRHVGGIASRDRQLAKTGLYSKDEENLGNIRRYGIFGSIIFSPPYMNAIKGSGRKREEAIKAMRKAGISEKRIQTFMGDLGCIKWQEDGYSRDKDQMGNLDGQTYLSEMSKVYSECYRVLKPGRFMVVVVKDIQSELGNLLSESET